MFWKSTHGTSNSGNHTARVKWFLYWHEKAQTHGTCDELWTDQPWVPSTSRGGQRALDATPGGYEHSSEAVAFFFCLQLFFIRSVFKALIAIPSFPRFTEESSFLSACSCSELISYKEDTVAFSTFCFYFKINMTDLYQFRVCHHSDSVILYITKWPSLATVCRLVTI